MDGGSGAEGRSWRDDRVSSGEQEQHYGEMMARYLGPVVIRAFRDDDVAEIYVNLIDGAIRFDTRSQGESRRA